MNLIILAAGDSFELDGYNKLLLKNPKTNKTILEEYIAFFENIEKVTIVVGYKAIEVMNKYPEFNYIFNKKWQTTGSGYSLSLAIEEKPSIIIESDFFISENLKQSFNKLNEYVVLKKSESKRVNSLKAKIDDGFISNVYSGKTDSDDPEILGFYKVSDIETMRLWKKNGIMYPERYISQTFPFNFSKLTPVIVSKDDITEINTPLDYINFIQKD